jgi:hypothetical protein
MTDTLAALDLSLRLAPAAPRQWCGATRRGRWGWIVATCSFHPGHVNDHRDIHTGRTWK